MGVVKSPWTNSNVEGQMGKTGKELDPRPKGPILPVIDHGQVGDIGKKCVNELAIRRSQELGYVDYGSLRSDLREHSFDVIAGLNDGALDACVRGRNHPKGQE